VLSKVDKVQDRMLKIAGTTDVEALLMHNLAPLSIRRDIAMLGIIHRAALGKGPAQLQYFFQREVSRTPLRTRLQFSRHEWQLQEYRDDYHTDCIGRSILGLVTVYNLLPCSVVATSEVSKFQSSLQSLVKERAIAACERWEELLSPRIETCHHPLMRDRW